MTASGPEWVPAFECIYDRTGNLTLSAELAGVTKGAVYDYMRRRREFRDRVECIRRTRRERRLERVLRRGAFR